MATTYGWQKTNFCAGLDHWIGGLSETPAEVTNIPRSPGALRRNSSFETLATTAEAFSS